MSAGWLDACIEGPQGENCRVANTAEGVDALALFCRRWGVGLVVMEASGGYERLAFARLWGEGIACAVVNPRAVRRFAEAMGLLEKTDRIDAKVIAWYARAKRIVPTAPGSARQRQLTTAVTRMRQLVALRVAQLNQRRLVDDLY
jgi:transposase